MREISFKKSDSVKVIAEIASYIDSLENDKNYSITFKEKKPKRSLNANSYAWTLLDKLAEKLSMSKTELYKAYIREIGGNNYLMCCIEEAAADFCEMWQKNGIGWVTDYEPSKLPNCVNIRAYKGSSEYDTAQMSRLINLIVQDCKQYGIETMTPEELERLSNDWGR